VAYWQKDFMKEGRFAGGLFSCMVYFVEGKGREYYQNCEEISPL